MTTRNIFIALGVVILLQLIGLIFLNNQRLKALSLVGNLKVEKELLEIARQKALNDAIIKEEEKKRNALKRKLTDRLNENKSLDDIATYFRNIR